MEEGDPAEHQALMWDGLDASSVHPQLINLFYQRSDGTQLYSPLSDMMQIMS